MTTKHTPGPWRVEKAVDPNARLITSGHYDVIATVKGLTKKQYYEPDTYMSAEENQANAHLIAAAPEMASMLEGIIEQLSRFDYKSKRNDIWNSSLIDNALQLAKHGLAKARGEV